MAQTVIKNPILNSPFEEPTRHFRFSDDGITDEIVEARRVSSYFMPVPASKTKGKQAAFDTEWTRDRVEENVTINRIRFHVGRWRLNGRPGVTATSRRLLEYWADPERENKLFFCQIEALETVIYITEVAKKDGAAWIENNLRDFNQASGSLQQWRQFSSLQHHCSCPQQRKGPDDQAKCEKRGHRGKDVDWARNPTREIAKATH
ncbi:MAG: hypothetical protein H0U16_11465 [Actinobacteria bacterium]|nr:hypothetical protein [Actinomycetota bacterium]